MTIGPQSVEYDGTWNGEMGMEWKNESRKDKLVLLLKGLTGHDFILGTMGSHCTVLSGV